MRKRPWQDVLIYYDPSKVPNRFAVRTAYRQYRKEKGIPDRCDNPNCRFHHDPLEWNGMPLDPTLDHRNGVSRDNKPKNLWWLCPNCDSQLPTRGGRNKGMVEYTPGGYSRKRDRKSNLRDHVLPAGTGTFSVTLGNVKGTVRPRGDAT